MRASLRSPVARHVECPWHDRAGRQGTVAHRVGEVLGVPGREEGQHDDGEPPQVVAAARCDPGDRRHEGELLDAVADRVEPSPERAVATGEPGDLAVDAVDDERRLEQHGGEHPRPARVDGRETARHEAEEEADEGDDVGRPAAPEAVCREAP